MKGDAWTDDRISRLRILWTQGLTAAQIAKQLGGGLTRNAVIGKRIRLGLPDRAIVHSHRSGKRSSRACGPPKVAKQLSPKLRLDPVLTPRAPRKGPNSVRFIERKLDQCPMFCAGEEGAAGFVCGEAVEFGSTWCAACRALCYRPVPAQREAA